MSTSRANPSLALALAALGTLAACSTIDGGGTGTSATSGLPPPPASDDDTGDAGADETGGGMGLGPEDFDYCFPGPEGTPILRGWHIACTAPTATRSFVNPLDSTYLELEDFSGIFGNVCCGGLATLYEADMACQLLCLELLCEAARVQHVAWAVDVSDDGMGGDCLDVTENCGFDFDLCMTGDYHEQHGQPGMLFSYIMQAECGAAHDQDLSPYSEVLDKWTWVEDGNDPTNDPAVCAPIPEPEPGPPEGTPEHEMEEEPGTSVTLRWSVGGGTSHTEQSLDVAVDLAYAVVPCTSGDCIGLSRFHVTIPDGTYHGLELRNAHLVLERATEDTPLSASGAFSLGPKTLAATLSLTVDGIPIVLTGFNEGHARGVAQPRFDTMTLNNLVFDFDDGVIDAELELNINGSYVRHAPDALIKVIDAPTDCALPVTFEAASHDLDGDSLTHTWWVPPWFLGEGTLLEATLPPGSYRVYLTSTDPSGRSDSTALHHVRSCQ